MTQLENLQPFTEQIETIQTTITNFYQTLKNNTFHQMKDETDEHAFKRGQGIVEQFQESLMNLNKMIEQEQKMNQFFETCKENKQRIMTHTNELINELLRIKKRSSKTKDEYIKTRTQMNTMRNETAEMKNRREVEEILEEIKEEKEEVNKTLIEIKKVQEELKEKVMTKNDMFEAIEEYPQWKAKTTYNLEMNQLTQIEEWTKLKCGEIIFDSTQDNWEIKTSTFDDRILNKNKLVFIIEDTEGNKFGGYIDAIINKIFEKPDWKRITDPKSFVFSLESNGRLKGMKKFDIKEPRYAFYLFNKSLPGLFSIGDDDIIIYKKGSGRKHYCLQRSFAYERNQNTLCGKEYFELKQFIVIQMK